MWKTGKYQNKQKSEILWYQSQKIITSGLKLQPRINVKSVERRSSLLEDIKLEVEQIKKKLEEKLLKPLFIKKSIIFKKRNDHKLSIKKLNSQVTWEVGRHILIVDPFQYLWLSLFLSQSKQAA